MKLRSLNYLAQHAGRTFLRFPLSIITGFLGVCVAIYLVEQRSEIENVFPYLNLLLTFGLGIPLFFCADVFYYAKDVSRSKRYLLYGLVLLILLVIYFSLPGFDSTQNTLVPYVRYTIYNIAVHLLVAFVPFLVAGQLNGFWHYNKILFVRILAGLLYSGVLYAGLALALGSLDFLFDVTVHEELYFDLFIFISGVFNTWFFLAGVPGDFHTLDDIREYPKGIKIFSQYVLLPLLALYVLILYIYAGKIVFLWSWPKGIVSYLITAVGVLGILTLLLIHPYGYLSGNAWIRKLSRAYYFILVPLIVLLFIAISMRISDYGVTVNRYVIMLLGVWLTIISAYFIAGKQNIKFIPISLAIILILVSFGAWGIFSVSEQSQVQRLRAILEHGSILKDGKIRQEVMWLRDSLPKTFLAVDGEETNDNQLPDSLHNEVKSILDYLDDHHGFTSIRGWFTQNLDSMVKENNKVKTMWHMNEAETYMRSMGLPYHYKDKYLRGRYYSYEVYDHEIVNVAGFDYLLNLNRNANDTGTFRVGNIQYKFLFPTAPDHRAWLISGNDSVKFEVGELVKTLVKKYGHDNGSQVPEYDMSITSDSQTLNAKMQLYQLSMQGSPDTLDINYLTGVILLRLKK